MKHFKYISGIILFILLIKVAVSQEIKTGSPKKGFVSWIPAATADDALLSGNGAMGVMVYGRPHDEVIVINHALSFLPNRVPLKPIDQASHLAEIRKLLAEGNYNEAAQVPVDISMAEGYGGQIWNDQAVPVLNLKINMKPGNVTNYKRMVNFETGEALVQWNQDGEMFQRTVFVSRPDSVIVVKIISTGKINASFSFDRHPVEWNQWSMINETFKSLEISAKDGWLGYRTEFVYKWTGNPEGFESVGKVVVKDGSITDNGREISVKDVSEVTILVKLEPNFNWQKPLDRFLKSRINSLTTDSKALLERHKKVHGELFKRVSLNIGNSADSLLDSEPLRLEARKKVTPTIIMKEFDAARYNIISCMGINPPHLQGIWSATWTPPWSSDFTHDGNVQTAISGVLSTSTPELMMAYVNYHERMMPMYRENAQRLFGCRGIIVPSHTSSHGYNDHFDKTWCMTFWTAGAGWTASFFYDYYLYTGDKDFLANHAYPFMKETAQFYEDFLFTDATGKYVFSPSYSPENNPANGTAQACINATMDVMVAKEVLQNCIAAAEILKTDKDKVALWKTMLTKMPDYSINADGALAEWIWPNMPDNYRHRHISQLYALFDRVSPDFKTNTALRNAAAKTLKYKIDFRRSEDGGEMAFGLAQIGMVACNLENNTDVSWIINKLAGDYWTNSLASQHNNGNLFNMDISGGFPALVVKSLIYSEPGYISLLPALSPDWKSGSLNGTSLRGALKAEQLNWDEKQVILDVRAPAKQTVVLHIPFDFKSLTVNGKLVKTKPGTDANIQLEAGITNKIMVMK